MTQDEHIERKEIFGHPVGLYVLFFTELWERFSYYGMRAILTLYMISSATAENAGLGWNEGNALALYGWYTMLVYVMSIPGGILADKFIGQKKSVLIGGLILVAGHGILAFDTLWAFYTGLILIVIGVGGLKPNISTMVGGLYPPGDERRDNGFTIFYIGINIGALLASLVVGAIGETIGWHYGFGLAGIGMLVGQVVYMAGQKHLVGVGDPPTKTKNLEQTADDEKHTSLGELFKNLLKSPKQLIITIILGIGGIMLAMNTFEGFEKGAYGALFLFLALCTGLMMMIYKDVNKIEKDRFVVLLLSFLIVIVFWGAFEQAGGLMNIYTKQKIDRVVPMLTLDIIFFGAALFLLAKGVYDLTKKKDSGYILGGSGLVVLIAYLALKMNVLTDPYQIPASVFQSVNPLFIIIFGTIVANLWLWWRHRGKESSSLFKMAVGTMIMGVGFIFMGMASQQASAGVDEKGMLMLVILAYLFHTIGELSSSPVALSFVTKVAPVKYVSIMMGMYFAATGLGNKVAGSIGESSQVEPVNVEIAENQVTGISQFVADSTLNAGKNFDMDVALNFKDGQMMFSKDGKSVDNLFDVEEGGESTLLERTAEEPGRQYTAILKFEKKKEAADDAPVHEMYQGEIQIWELQNEREFRTFIMIFVFTFAFGILLLLFLKKLKRLTHGADDGTPKEQEA